MKSTNHRACVNYVHQPDGTHVLWHNFCYYEKSAVEVLVFEKSNESYHLSLGDGKRRLHVYYETRSADFMLLELEQADSKTK